MEASERLRPESRLPWIGVHRDAPYFSTENGDNWTPVAQNDGITWPGLRGLYARNDLPSVERYLKSLTENGVTVLRLMLEYSQDRRHYFEGPPGRFSAPMIQLWDDLFGLCEKCGLRILLTPVDTYWMWLKWDYHPWNIANGGPRSDPANILLCPEIRRTIKERLSFAIERWASSGALFAWDLWNEIHPSRAQATVECFAEFIDELSTLVRTREVELYGRAHPQTISVFGPNTTLDPRVPESICRRASIDFASTNFLDVGAADSPRNTVEAALWLARLMREGQAGIPGNRPLFHGERAPAAGSEFRNTEFFRNVQWAHLCSGGAGGGLRWPNRPPYELPQGMRDAERSLASFLSRIDFGRFHRRNLNHEARTSISTVRVVACGDNDQALVWLVRSDTIREDGTPDPNARPIRPVVSIPGLAVGRYNITAWDTLQGKPAAELSVNSSGFLYFQIPDLVTDMALAVRRIGGS